MLGRVDHHHAVLVEQALVALDQHRQISAVLEVQPGATVGQHISAQAGRHVQRRAHAATAGLVAGKGGRLDARRFPVAQLGCMGAAFVAARNKTSIGHADLFHRFGDVLALDLRRVSGRANQHEVVVHDRVALERIAFGHHFFFSRLVVNEQHIGVAPAAHVDGLAGADRHHFHVDAGGFLELRQQIRKQPRLLGRGRRRHHDAGCLRYRNSSCQRNRDKRQKPERLEKPVKTIHPSSPFKKLAAAGGKGPLKNRALGKSATSWPCSRYSTRLARRLT